MDSLVLGGEPLPGDLDETLRHYVGLYEELARDSRVTSLTKLLGCHHVELTSNVHARVMVSVQTLSNAEQHLGMIQERCLKANV
mmetsp:Transcript_125799/g.280638  ORF Transcript_125799/g.280638 Transcript_125799/m.280638 type:complete len:84 (+) Transcript_125799:3-254(+)